ncbi:hypothetical protein GQ42DRAFT_12564 [Ramicandelaber brevisporus]|nr:hypothetical protein GQ42DRAFT_12564 [Ramicandelaber brevisporus]
MCAYGGKWCLCCSNVCLFIFSVWMSLSGHHPLFFAERASHRTHVYFNKHSVTSANEELANQDKRQKRQKRQTTNGKRLTIYDDAADHFA